MCQKTVSMTFFTDFFQVNLFPLNGKTTSFTPQHFCHSWQLLLLHTTTVCPSPLPSLLTTSVTPCCFYHSALRLCTLITSVTPHRFCHSSLRLFTLITSVTPHHFCLSSLRLCTLTTSVTPHHFCLSSLRLCTLITSVTPHHFCHSSLRLFTLTTSVTPHPLLSLLTTSLHPHHFSLTVDEGALFNSCWRCTA